jgi:hypothetical protein
VFKKYIDEKTTIGARPDGLDEARNTAYISRTYLASKLGEDAA